jgi:site-specific DNA recombinase
MPATKPPTAKSPRKRPAAEPDKVRRLSAVIRVSRRNAREGDSFMSPQQQREVIDAYAKRIGAVIEDEWRHDETDSVSGKTTDRAGLQAALAQALDGTTDGVIVAKVDRFARNLSEGLTAVRELHEAGKVFIAVNDGIDGRNPRNIGAKVLLTVMLLFAEWQLETLTDGWVATRKRHIEAGVATNVPYGYRRTSMKEGRRLVPDPEQAKWVEWIFERRAADDAGAGLAKIAAALNAKGVTPPQPPPGKDGTPKRASKLWVHTHVDRVLRNRVYLGELRSGDEIVNLAAHTPLVKLELWEKANAQRSTPGTRGDRTVFLLAGIARCASCGGRMAGMTDRTRPTVYRWYRCRRSYHWGICPKPASVAAEELDSAVRRTLEGYVEKRRASGRPVTEGLEAAEAGLAEAQADLERYMADEVVGRLLRTNPAAWQAGAQAREIAVEAARRERVTARAAARSHDLPEDLPEQWGAWSDDKKRATAGNVVAVVAVWPGKGRGHRAGPVSDRAWVFPHGDADLPANLPGLGGGSAITPIPWPAA